MYFFKIGKTISITYKYINKLKVINLEILMNRGADRWCS